MSGKRALDLLLGAGLGGAGVYAVMAQFSQPPDPALEASMPADVKNSRLKKTLR
jgi:hypothetical protein